MDRKKFKTEPQTLVTDPRSGEIKKIIHPADTEIGLDGLPRDLIVHGEIIGSIQETSEGLPYLVAGTNVQIASGTNGQVTISASGAAGAPSTVAYVTIGNSASLSAERALAVGTGLRLTDGGPDASVTLDVKDNVYASLTGSNSFSGNATFSAALSGSIQRTSGGVSYLVGGTNVTVTTGSNGQITIAAAAASGAPSGGQYITLATDPGLSAERVLSPSTGLFFTDGGANGNYAIGVNDSVFAALSGANFTGPVNFAAGQIVTFNGALSGSLSRLPNGLSFLAAGPNTTITTSSNGQVTISSTGGTSTGGGDPDPSYLTLALTASLPNERVFTPGTGLKATDGGANGAYTLNGDDGVFATISGSTFAGAVVAASAFGFTGSLTKLVSGAPFLTSPSGNVITLLTGSGGQVVISGSGGANQGAPLGARYLTLATDAELTSERLFTPGMGLKATDGGAGGAYTLNANDSVLATVSGSTFTGPVVGAAAGGFTGSLTRLTTGAPFITVPAGNMITVTTGSNGQIILSGSGDGTGASTGAPTTAQYITLATDASLSAERVLVPSTGIFATDGGANGNYTFGVNDRFFAALTGSVFSGPIVAAAATGITGSITQLVGGAPFITSPAGNIITVTTGSGGQIIISGSGDGTGVASSGGGGDPGAQYLVLAATASLSSERVLTPSTGLKAVDAGANGNYTLTVHDGTFAALTGSIFTGAVSHDSAGVSALLKGTDVFFYVSGSLNLASGVTRKVAVFGGDVFSSGSISAPWFSGSIQLTQGGLPYLVGQGATVISSQSNGQIFISSSAGTGAPAGASSTFQINASGSFSGSTGFTYDLVANRPVAGPGGLELSNALGSFGTIIKGAAVAADRVASLPLLAGNDTFTMDSFATTLANKTLTAPVINTPNFGANNIISTGEGRFGKIYTSGTLQVGASSPTTIATEQVMWVSGSSNLASGATRKVAVFGGDVIGSGSFQAPWFSGSIQKTFAGLSYLVASGAATITSSSNGQITIFAPAGGGSVVGSDTQVIFNDGGAAYNGDSGLTFNKTTDALTAGRLTASFGLSSSFAQLAGTDQGGYLALVGGTLGRVATTGTLRLGGGNGVYVDHIVVNQGGSDMTFLNVHDGASYVNVGDPNYLMTWRGYSNTYAVNAADKHYFYAGATQLVSFDIAKAVFDIGISGSVVSLNDHLALHGGSNPVANSGTIRTGYDADPNFPLWKVLDSNLADRTILRYGLDTLTFGGIDVTTKLYGSTTEIRGSVVQIANTDGTLQSEFYPGLGYIGGTPHSFDNSPAFTQAAVYGTDIWLHVSGSRNTTPARTIDVDPVSVDRHVVVFGGDVVMSGSLSLTSTTGNDANIWMQQGDYQYEIFNGNLSSQQWFGSSAFNVYLRGFSANIYGYSAGCSAYDGRNAITTDLAVVSQRLTTNFVTASLAPINSPFTFAVNAGEIWEIEMMGTCGTTSTGGCRFAVMAPTGSKVDGWVEGSAATLASTMARQRIINANQVVTTSVNTQANTPGPVKLFASLLVGANSGACTIAMNTIAANVATLYSGSYFTARRADAV